MKSPFFAFLIGCLVIQQTILSTQEKSLSLEKGFTNITFEVDLSKDILFPNEHLKVDFKATYPLPFSLDSNGLLTSFLKAPPFGFPPFKLISKEENKKIEERLVFHHLILTLEPQLEGPHPLSFGLVPFTYEGERFKIPSPVHEVFVNPFPSPKEFSFTPYHLPLERKFYPEMGDKNTALLTRLASLEQKKFFRQNAYIWLLLQAIFGVVVVLSIIWIVNPFGKKLFKTTPTPKFYSTKQALAHLKNLSLTNLNPIEFFTYLSLILKKWVSHKANLDPTCLTTEELLSFLSKEERDSIKELLTDGDKIKFALYLPTKEECEQKRQFMHHLLSKEALKNKDNS